MLYIDFEGFTLQYLGLWLSNPDINDTIANGLVVINEVEMENQFDYLKPARKIYCLRHLDYNGLILDIEFEGWILNQVCILTNKRNSQKWNIFRTSTPVVLPEIFTLSTELTLDNRKIDQKI